MWPLDFFGNLEFSPVRDLLAWRKSDVPRQPGAYLLLARPEVTFRYPRAESPLFYIGQTKNLRRRLYNHQRGIRQASHNRRLCLYRPTREYGAAFGAHYAFVLAEAGGKPRDLEDLVMARFACHHSSLPVANGAGAWNRLRAIIKCEG